MQSATLPADAHVALGLIRQLFDWNLSAGDSALREAVRLNPGHAEAYHELSMLLTRVGRFDDAEDAARHALDLAPMSARFVSGLGEVTAYAGRTSEALAVADRLVTLDSASSAPYYVRGVAFEQLRQYDRSAQAWAAVCARLPAQSCGTARGHIGYAYAATGRRSLALLAADSLEAQLRRAMNPALVNSIELALATVHTGLGDRAEALKWLERAAEPHTEQMMLYLTVDPVFRSLHTEPRFQALLRRIGLPS